MCSLLCYSGFIFGVVKMEINTKLTLEWAHITNNSSRKQIHYFISHATYTIVVQQSSIWMSYLKLHITFRIISSWPNHESCYHIHATKKKKKIEDICDARPSLPGPRLHPYAEGVTCLCVRVWHFGPPFFFPDPKHASNWYLEKVMEKNCQECLHNKDNSVQM